MDVPGATKKRSEITCDLWIHHYYPNISSHQMLAVYLHCHLFLLLCFIHLGSQTLLSLFSLNMLHLQALSSTRLLPLLSSFLATLQGCNKLTRGLIFMCPSPGIKTCSTSCLVSVFFIFFPAVSHTQYHARSIAHTAGKQSIILLNCIYWIVPIFPTFPDFNIWLITWYSKTASAILQMSDTISLFQNSSTSRYNSMTQLER